VPGLLGQFAWSVASIIFLAANNVSSVTYSLQIGSVLQKIAYKLVENLLIFIFRRKLEGVKIAY
jgi:hypothetical protein